jgi:hypothetical protein
MTDWLKEEFERINTPAEEVNTLRSENSLSAQRNSILQEADLIVNGERAVDYGDAIESFQKVSTMATLLANKEISPLDCCLVLKAVKLVRESYKHKRDNLVDECGYAEIENRIRTWIETE